MAFYYKTNSPEISSNEIQTHQTHSTTPSNGPVTKFDFSKHVLIELLDDVTAETKLWEELGVTCNKHIIHKRLIVDSHRAHCRRAIVVCSTTEEAASLAQRVSQTKIINRCVCAVVVQELLFDFWLFEKQILHFGDKNSQHQLLYVSDLNRCREPAGLVQYLKEKFSPFGTILSVFVAEDKNGYAYPEAVIKFSYLSEAFAAEIAYDQCVVGMERLSVTAHHNILLSQCDLRVRLREAQSRHNELLNKTSFVNQDLCKLQKDKFIRNRSIISSPSLIFSEKESEATEALRTECFKNGRTEANSCKIKNNFLSDTGEHKNIVHSSYQKSPIKIPTISLPVLPKEEEIWSSKVGKWIANVPNSAHLLSSSNNHSLTVRDDQELIKENDGKSLDFLSVDGSFITCDEGSDGNSDVSVSTLSSAKLSKNTKDFEPTTCSYITCESLPKQNFASSLSSETTRFNDTVLHSDANSLPKLKPKDFHCLEKLSTISENGIENCSDSSFLSVIKSHSRKRKCTLSHKLSLKNIRQDSLSETLTNESTLHLSASEHQNKNAKSNCCSEVIKSPVVLLKRISSTEIKKLCFRASQEQFQKSFDDKVQNAKAASPKGCLNSDTLQSTLPLPTRRSSRLISRISNSVSKKNHGKESTLELTSDSPLRIWLRKELESSINNRMSNNIESAKRIVCATINKDVFTYVGCSHMTCEFCYPKSTNLLFGF